MPCYRPLQAWRGKVQKSGKRAVVFKRAGADPALLFSELTLPCGQCIGCRLERSRQWAMRCIDEASLYEKNCFISLTYNKENLPSNCSLDVTVFQKFMKRLRKAVGKVRFFHCGEYGSEYKRPHYHCLLFGYDFPDKEFLKVTQSGEKIYRSALLETLWPYGYSSVGTLTFESAAYVARYVLDKVTGPDAARVGSLGLSHYQRLDAVTGEIHDIKPEYVTMSRRPGIGKGWYQKYKLDMFPSDERIINGVKTLPARYYGSLYEAENPDDFRRIKNARQSRAVVHAADNDSFRLPVKEEVKRAQLRALSRKTWRMHNHDPKSIRYLGRKITHIRTALFHAHCPRCYSCFL